MAVILVDSFDSYNGIVANTGLAAKWTTANTGRLVMDTGRFTGSQAVRMGDSATASSPQITRGFTAGASFTIAFAFQVTNLSNMNAIALGNSFCIVQNSATFMDGLWVTNGGVLHAGIMTAISTGTSRGNSGSQVIFNNTWHYIEFSGTIDDTTGSLVVKVDGATVINATGVDTRNGSPTTVDTLLLACNRSAAVNDTNRCYFDDLYVLDSATSLGERRVETLYPTSDVAQGFTRSAGSTNYTLVDEAQVNGDTDYVQGSAVNDVDTYGFGDLSNSPTTIDAVQISVFAEKTDATSRSIALQAKSGATTSDGSNFALAASYGKHERLMTTDPNGSVTWTAAAVNALTGGPKVTV